MEGELRARTARRAAAGSTRSPARRAGTACGATVAVALLALLPLAAAAPWEQPRHDAAGTGATPDPGPAWGDVALRVPLPGFSGGIQTTPVILDREVLVPYRTARSPDARSYALAPGGGVLRVDLDTGAVRPFVDVDRPSSVATDGDFLYVAHARGVTAYALEDGREAWSWAWRTQGTAGEIAVDCFGGIRRTDEALRLVCTELAFVQRSVKPTTVVAKLDAASGNLLWHRVFGAAEYAAGATGRALEPADGATGNFFGVGGALLGSAFVVTGQDGSGLGLGGTTRSVAWGLDDATGRTLWVQIGSPRAGTVAVDVFPGAVLESGAPTGSAAAAFVKLDGLRALNPVTGATLWEQDLGREDSNASIRSVPGLAYADGSVFAASAQTVYRFDADHGSTGWRSSVTPVLSETLEESLVATPTAVYAGSWNPTDGSGAVYAFAADDGRILWRAPEDDPQGIAVGEGVLVYTDFADIELVVLGRTGASPTPDPRVATTFPAPGDEVRVDLSASGDGLNGPVTRYRADWGDGAATDWQETPVFTHAYAQAGAVTARFFVANDAGQTASEAVVFHVGATAPNFLSTAFSPENQETTFFVLGLVVTAGAGALGLLRYQKRRTRLQRELAAVEAAHEATKNRPVESEAALAERKAHARGLLLDGKLDEAQFQIVERRIDDLARASRVGDLDARFPFLPLGIANALKRALADGRITAFEREAVLDALRRDDVLTEAQKEKVRRLVESWTA